MSLLPEELRISHAGGNAVRRLVKEMCANYDSYYKICAPIDKPCPLMGKELSRRTMCRYFVRAVLPLNPALEASIKRTVVEKKACGMCGKEFVPSSNRAIYCSKECESIGTRIKNRKRKQKEREKSAANVTI